MLINCSSFGLKLSLLLVTYESEVLRNVTPYEHWYGKKPDVSNLKVFGCKAYVYVPDAKCKGKFGRESILCVFVGYRIIDNGFKFYNPQTKQMLQSRDVIFMEKKFKVEISDYTWRTLSSLLVQ